MDINKLPKKSIVMILVCGLGLMGVFMFTLFSNYRALVKLEGNISQLSAQIKTQDLFVPLFRELFIKMRKK